MPAILDAAAQLANVEPARRYKSLQIAACLRKAGNVKG
jgi:hypothetical protein